MSDAPLWTTAEIARVTGGECRVDVPVTGIQIDSRLIQSGDLFCALSDVRDGHDFVDSALNAGAAAALVSRPTGADNEIIVPDVLRALEMLGVHARERAPRRVAITGSVGKTTVTQLLCQTFGYAGSVHGPVKSFNNHIGVPITLARMPQGTDVGVFELGMNAPGEIAPLSRFVAPGIAVITKIAPVHIEQFDNELGIAHEKLSIADGLQPGGTLVVPAGTPYDDLFERKASDMGVKLLRFGDGGDAAVTDRIIKPDGQLLCMDVMGQSVDVHMHAFGDHWPDVALTVLLAIAVAGVDVAHGIKVLSAFRPTAGRGQVVPVEIGGGRSITLVDDSYNANPTSVRAALSALSCMDGRRIFVLSDMLELGGLAEQAHADLSQAVTDAGVDVFFGLGPLTKSLYDALPEQKQGRHLLGEHDVSLALDQVLTDGDVVLIKGSNASGAHKIAQTLRNAERQHHNKGKMDVL